MIRRKPLPETPEEQAADRANLIIQAYGSGWDAGRKNAAEDFERYAIQIVDELKQSILSAAKERGRRPHPEIPGGKISATVWDAEESVYQTALRFVCRAEAGLALKIDMIQGFPDRPDEDLDEDLELSGVKDSPCEDSKSE